MDRMCVMEYGMIIMFIIIIFLVINQKKMYKNKENFALGPDDLTAVRNEINRIYDMDVEAIRNLGHISKSLLTGTNTFTTSTTGKPGELTIPADNTIMQKDLTVNGTTKINGNLIVNGSILLPPGIIMAWYQATAPAGWGLCDGTKYGTIQSPDLRGRFIMMATTGITNETIYNPTDTANVDFNTITRGNPSARIGTYTFGKNGGSDYRVMNINEMPIHNHSASSNAQFLNWNGNGSLRGCGWCGTDGPAVQGSTTTTDNKGSSWGFGVLSPYHVLVYIIKL